jgi:hypothetical protein
MVHGESKSVARNALIGGLRAQFPRKYITAHFPVTYAGKGKEHGKVGINLILYAVELHIL